MIRSFDLGDLVPLLRGFSPASGAVSGREAIRSGLGALVGIGFAAAFALLLAGPPLPLLIPPMGASAVLLFAVPSSPLAQPWNLLVGNLVAGLIGVSAAALVPDPLLAAALAIGLAIAAMLALRCLHPPSGAVALTAVLGGPAIHQLGYGFVLWPVLGNSLLLLIAALAYNRLARRSYPHSLAAPRHPHKTEDPPQLDRIGFASEDLDSVLRDMDAVIDINREDLELILRRTELRSLRRRSGMTRCGEIMSRDVVAVAPDAPLREAHALMSRHHIKALPVTDDQARILGIVTQTDLLDRADWRGGRPGIGVRQRLRLALAGASAPNGIVKDIMTRPVRTVSPDMPISEAIVLFAEEGLHYLPAIDAGEKLVGIVSQSDVLVAMLADKAA
ncbi:HPP family protein [Rhizobium sp. YIM 134829]|uniref:HPP family protein n=1 Tax=Rhizobium sp. YIM 134829 TaxID=3390453 RepID=UPI00397CE1FD